MARTIRLLFLGTGGALPTRERLTSCIMVEDWNGYTILLDAGEACQISLMKHGYSTTRIDLVAVTHSHGDHVNGLPGLLQSMAVNKRKRALKIVAPPSVTAYVRETLEATETGERLGFPVQLLETRDTGETLLWERGGDRLALSWFRTCHTRDSVGFRLQWYLRPRVRIDTKPPGPELWRAIQAGLQSSPSASVVYTGDTAPCRTVLDASKNADILIHESTFSHEMEEEALERLHSTARHAATIAAAAGVGILVLTHISARYSGYEAKALLREAREVYPRSVLAYDGMRLMLLAPTLEVPLSRILASL